MASLNHWYYPTTTCKAVYHLPSVISRESLYSISMAITFKVKELSWHHTCGLHLIIVKDPYLPLYLNSLLCRRKIYNVSWSSNIDRLSLNNNALSSTLPATATMTSLTYLDVSENSLSGGLDPLKNTLKLETFKAAVNQVIPLPNQDILAPKTQIITVDWIDRPPRKISQIIYYRSLK